MVVVLKRVKMMVPYQVNSNPTSMYSRIKTEIETRHWTRCLHTRRTGYRSKILNQHSEDQSCDFSISASSRRKQETSWLGSASSARTVDGFIFRFHRKYINSLFLRFPLFYSFHSFLSQKDNPSTFSLSICKSIKSGIK